MLPDASRWRSVANYEHVDTLSASDLAWEWLRRNESYDSDYEALKDPGTDREQLTEKIRQHWGLRFRRRSRPRPA
ncbi:transcriptional regulator domain-containing protein [Rhizobium lusitanum]|uniref:transcriptional regulator domain-containing protein n=1 Tax=Rhizobium lusitanum TaxID=293958 RepID=UPI0015723CEB|nr:DUF6499 domain-containing protein [Rhizobium lusitanum]NTJ06939.1 hypothetical protein [Rhizobium lusitanum]